MFSADERARQGSRARPRVAGHALAPQPRNVRAWLQGRCLISAMGTRCDPDARVGEPEIDARARSGRASRTDVTRPSSRLRRALLGSRSHSLLPAGLRTATGDRDQREAG